MANRYYLKKKEKPCVQGYGVSSSGKSEPFGHGRDTKPEMHQASIY